METRARVVEIRGARARLACEDAEHCGLCGSGRGCAMRLLGGSNVRSIDLPARDTQGRRLEAGDTVTLAVADRSLVRAAAAVYLPTVAGLIAGAALARWLLGAGDGPGVVAALAGAALGFALGRRLQQFRAAPVVVRVVRGPHGG